MEQAHAKSSKSNKLKDKKIIAIVAAVVVILLVAVVGFLLMSQNKSSSNNANDEIVGSDLPELSPEDIGMEVTLRDDNRAVMFELTNADDIESVEYVIEYEAETEEGRANQGIFGVMNIGEDGITKTDFREFGTCSAGRCRYDNVVSDVTITLKVTKKDGKTYQVIETVELDNTSEEASE